MVSNCSALFKNVKLPAGFPLRAVAGHLPMHVQETVFDRTWLALKRKVRPNLVALGEGAFLLAIGGLKDT